MMGENLHYRPVCCVNRERLSGVDDGELRWVVMRSLQNKVVVAETGDDGREVYVKRFGYENAERLFCEFFMPMKELISVVRGRRVIRREPAIAGMFFVRDSVDRIRELSTGRLGFELKYMRGRGYREPVVINDVEMNVFMRAIGSAEEVRFFSPDDSDLRGKIGRRVRIYKDESCFEGRIISFRGSKRRWLRIGIDGFLVAEMDFDIGALERSGQVIELLD